MLFLLFEDFLKLLLLLFNILLLLYSFCWFLWWWPAFLLVILLLLVAVISGCWYWYCCCCCCCCLPLCCFCLCCCCCCCCLLSCCFSLLFKLKYVLLFNFIFLLLKLLLISLILLKLLWNIFDWCCCSCCCCCCSCCEYLMWPLKLFLVLLRVINVVVILSVVVKEEVKDVLCLFRISGGNGGIKSKFNCCCSGSCINFALLFPCLCLICCFSCLWEFTKISFSWSSFPALPLCWALYQILLSLLPNCLFSVIRYNSSLFSYNCSAAGQLTLDHQSQTRTAWLKTVPLGQRKEYWWPECRHQCQT